MVCVVSNGGGKPRVGFTLSRKVGNSVVRHRYKRRLKEVFRRWEGRAKLPSLDIVFHVHPSLAMQSFVACEKEATELLKRVLAQSGGTTNG